MLGLATDTDPGWVQRVARDVDTLLIDHAHCEKKAASTAINLIFRYQEHAGLMVPLSVLAREELEHFELVLDLIRRRGATFGPLDPSPYAKRLHAAIRKPEPDRLLDTLLVCALIEARSCERMKLLSEHLPDPELRAFYEALLASEARHHAGYVGLAADRFGRDVVRVRLAALAEVEAEAVGDGSTEVRVHS